MPELADYETFEVIAAYLERQGVTNLRQRHAPGTVNRRAVLRYLIAQALRQALDHPPDDTGTIRRSAAAGPSRPRPARAPSSGKKRT